VRLLDLGLRLPSPESQPISNQMICKIQVPAIWGLSNQQNKCLKKTSWQLLQTILNNLIPTNEMVTIHQNSIWLRLISITENSATNELVFAEFEAKSYVQPTWVNGKSLSKYLAVHWHSIRSIWKELEDSSARPRARPAARLCQRAWPTCAGLGCLQSLKWLLGAWAGI